MRVYADAIGEGEINLGAEVPRSKQIVFSVHKWVQITRAWSRTKSLKAKCYSQDIPCPLSPDLWPIDSD